MKQRFVAILLIFNAIFMLNSIAMAENENVIKRLEKGYQFSISNEWNQMNPPNPTIDQFFYFAADPSIRFFVMTRPNPPHDTLSQDQVDALMEGNQRKFEDLAILQKQLVTENNLNTGILEFTGTEKSPKGSIKLHYYCKALINNKMFYNVCGYSKDSSWAMAESHIKKLFDSWKIIMP